jgi:hypothetical protein
MNKTRVGYHITAPALLKMLHKISGVPTFEVFSPLMGYSVYIYAVTKVMLCFIVRDLHALLFRQNDFQNAIYYSMTISIVVTSTCLPLLLWLDIFNYVPYLSKWTEFQVGIVENRKGFY